MHGLADRWFHLAARGTTVGRELRGALTTFLTMGYILVANPGILSAAGVPFDSAVAATALAAALCSLLMGVVANVPLALAPGMGLNAVVAYQLAATTGSWQAAMGLVVIEGALVLLLVLAGLREGVMGAIPVDVRRAIGVGIGLFIAFIGAANARLVVVPEGTLAGLSERPTSVLPPVGAGGLTHPDAWLALGGLLVTGWLLARRTSGAVLIGILITTAAAMLAGHATLPSGAWLQAPRLETVGAADLAWAWRWSALPLLLSLMMVDFFDTLGTATAIAEEAGLQDDRGRIPGLRRLLGVDALSASIGGWLGASSVTAYIESAAGVADGARTGLHSVGVAVLFLGAAFLAPLVAVVPPAATAPALIVVGFLMTSAITRIDFTSPDTALPAFVTILFVPLTWSIAHGIGYGLIAYVAMAALRGKGRTVHPLLYSVAAAFAAYFLRG